MAVVFTRFRWPSGRPRRRRPWHASGGQQADRAGEAFTILEALIGVVILTASIGALAVVTAQQWGRSTDVDVLDRVENAVASDLGWLKTYAKYWRLASGPYDLSCVQAGFPAGCTVRNFSAGTTDYQPDEALCATATGLADAFVTAAGSADSGTITPAPPLATRGHWYQYIERRRAACGDDPATHDHHGQTPEHQPQQPRLYQLHAAPERTAFFL